MLPCLSFIHSIKYYSLFRDQLKVVKIKYLIATTKYLHLVFDTDVISTFRMRKNRLDLKRSVAHRSAKIIVVYNFVTKNAVTSTLSFDDQPVVSRHNIDIVTSGA